MKMPVSDLSYSRKGDAVHLSINKGLPWCIEQMEDYLEKEGNKKTDVVIKSDGTPDWIKRIFRYQKPIRLKRGTLKVLNFAGIKFRDFAIFSLNREIKYQGETFQVYNHEIKYPRNLISGGF